ncbi:hypothetical protein [Desmospora activa]|uniref:Uncharacterized protein n=1 Tax=Desmospora activa DSM 45169 TaxID=1121389 RepID=A0A2T4ZA89_9BACL|nr:hypothetical protein [Desmospora activa]PTM58811.1 hypothetical protein C8J48_1404 [Desmospora activa DSM 45169]
MGDSSKLVHVNRAKREYQQQVTWWREQKPKAQLPPELEKLLRNNDPAFIQELKRFAVGFTVTVQRYNRETRRYERIEPNPAVDTNDGSWLWTLYLRKEPLAKEAVRTLLEYASDGEIRRMAENLVENKDRYYWINHWQYRSYWSGRYWEKFIPFSHVFFRYVKGIYKLAEQRKDEKIWSVLAYRFDVEKQFGWYLPQSLDPSKRFYSPKTHHYLRRRSWRTLRDLGEKGSPDYVRLATEALLCYESKNGIKRWDMDSKNYRDFSHLWLFNHILFHNSSRFVYKGSQTWKAATAESPDPLAWTEEREEAFPELWDHHPDQLRRLFLEGKAGPVIQFAARALIQGNPSYLQKISLEQLQDLLSSSEHYTRRKWATSLILDRLTHPDLQAPDFDAWMSFSTHQDPAIRKGATWFIHQYRDRWSNEHVIQLLQRFIADLRTKKITDPQTIKDWVELTQNAFAHVLSEITTIDLVKEMVESDHPALLELAASLLEQLDISKHPLTGAQLLPFLSCGHGSIQEAARGILSEHFVALELNGAILAEIASIPGEDHQAFTTQFFRERRLWMVPLLPEFLQEMWIRMLRSDLPDDVKGYIRDDLLGGLFFDELADIPFEKVLRLIESDQAELRELGERLFLLTDPEPRNLTAGQLLQLAHCPLARVREEVRNMIPREHHRLTDDLWVNLAETDWDDTRNWVFDQLEARPAEAISPDLIYGLLDTARSDVQQLAMTLVQAHEHRLDLSELMFRAAESPHLQVQEYALQLASRMTWRPESLQRMELFFRTVLFRVHGGRKAKEMALDLLLPLGEESRENAEVIVPLLADVSHNFGRQDFERVLLAITRIQDRYPDLQSPVTILA